MLLNAAEGLCISLREPARVLAHVPSAGGGPDATVVHKCCAALAKVLVGGAAPKLSTLNVAPRCKEHPALVKACNERTQSKVTLA